MVNSTALLTDRFPLNERIKALGYFGIIYSIIIYLQNDIDLSPLIAGLVISLYPISA
ncbi:MAG: hypothetical protein ACP5RZ_06095 [Thermoplasmata archaeon]